MGLLAGERAAALRARVGAYERDPVPSTSSNTSVTSSSGRHSSIAPTHLRKDERVSRSVGGKAAASARKGWGGVHAVCMDKGRTQRAQPCWKKTKPQEGIDGRDVFALTSQTDMFEAGN